MDPQTAARAFEPFFTTKEAGRGTGIGLSTVYSIVRRFAGHVFLYSEPGHGTTVRVYLPLVEPPHDAESAGLPTGRNTIPSGTETILLVEDEPMVRGIAREALLMSGYTVLEAGEGAEALDLARSHPGEIDLLMTDVVMPGISGRKLAEQIAAVRPGIRVLFMSGYTDEMVRRQGIADTGAAFIQKPFTAAELARAVRAALDSTEPRP
jgi:CheY-like chemotaxis protein